ncbi:uncharacterized protein [Periplaneta americana]|uniref:uncharacterized protein isoform X15 n=1 Tax=Periplaneta americana TaxID=6978 RepID=UPI0037E98D24
MADGDAVGLDKGNMSENTDFINIDKMVVVKMESQDNEEKEEVTLPAVKSEPQNDADTAEADTALWWCDVTKQECTVTDSSIMEPQSSDKEQSWQDVKPKEEVLEEDEKSAGL